MYNYTMDSEPAARVFFVISVRMYDDSYYKSSRANTVSIFQYTSLWETPQSSDERPIKN